MRSAAPFTAADLATLDVMLYSRASAVVPMRDIWAGNTDPTVIGLRHDVDDNAGSLDTAVAMGEWEACHGYRSTYYLLHGSHYWDRAPQAARELVAMGHEVGIHNNAIAEAIRQRRHPADILRESLHDLRSAVEVVGTVAHGDNLCYLGRKIRFVNDELFMECNRKELGGSDRIVTDTSRDPWLSISLGQRSLWDFGLKYDANWLPRADYLSDSGGRWSAGVFDVTARFPQARGQLHLLIHPDWWAEAFVTEQVAA